MRSAKRLVVHRTGDRSFPLATTSRFVTAMGMSVFVGAHGVCPPCSCSAQRLVKGIVRQTQAMRPYESGNGSWSHPHVFQVRCVRKAHDTSTAQTKAPGY